MQVEQVELEKHNSKPCEILDGQSCSSTPTPMCFKRVPHHVRSKRLEFLTSDHQPQHDILKKCFFSSCLAKIRRRGLQGIRPSYFSLNGEEQDTFLADRLQLMRDPSSGKNVSFEYYLNVNDRCCRKDFKIALGLGNLRLNRIQCRYISGDTFENNSLVEISGKGLVGQHAIY